MGRSKSAGFRRKLVGAIAAYAVALQAVLSGLGLAAFGVAPSAAAVPICSEHAANSAQPPALPQSDPWLCPCAAACATGCSVLSDPPAIIAVLYNAPLPAPLSQYDGARLPRPTSRGPQIPRGPPIG